MIRVIKLLDHIPIDQRPVVFIGPYEHHSNELPWRESIAEVVAIGLDSQGQIDQKQLEQQLCIFKHRKVKIGSFSAASNVTGLLSDVESISCLLHQYGALAFWDYAAAAPYVDIDVQGTGSNIQDSSMDAVFISPHKFVGGPGTPGILVVKKSLLNNRVPSVPGGGTVSFVTPQSHTYISDSQRREEGGTPAIIEAIRAGLVFQLKDAVGAADIERRESDIVCRVLERWKDRSDIQVLGNLKAPRTAIISLQICRDNKPLHYGFVVALLNDLFGIQARGGCSCAGPYGHSLLKLNRANSLDLEQAVANGHGILRPGWIRINFNYFFDEHTVDYLVRAIELIAQHGWKLLTQYDYDEKTGIWSYINAIKNTVIHDLHDLVFTSQGPLLPNVELSSRNRSFTTYLESALHILEVQAEPCTANELHPQWVLHPGVEHLRWFYLPRDAA